MKKQLQKFFAKKKNNKGFTLIELIIVIAILAILVGIVGMASIRYVEKSRKSADEQTLDSISTAAQAVIVDPDNNITLVSGAKIVVQKNSSEWVISSSGISIAGSAYHIGRDVTNDLAKKPSLKSQTYKDGATLIFSVSGSSIKVDETGWQPGVH